MATVHEQLSEQFYRWEQRGRGWQVFGEPVYPEPPFVPFDGHYLPNVPVVDDGRRPTFLSSLFRKVTAPPQPAPVIPEPEEEPEPVALVRDAAVVRVAAKAETFERVFQIVADMAGSHCPFRCPVCKVAPFSAGISVQWPVTLWT